MTSDNGALLDAERQLIGDIWTSDEPYQNLVYLCDEIGNRWAGSASEHRAGEFLQSKLAAYGLANVHLEPVQFGAWERGPATLELTAPAKRTFSCVALPYCPAGEVEAELIDVGEGEEEDFARLGDAVRGKIAISAAETNPVGRPNGKLSHRTDKLRRAVDAGAVAFVFVNQNPGLLHITGGIGAPGGKPAAIIGIGVSWETGSAILRLAKRANEPARLRITTSGRFFDNTSYNVVGEIPGATWPDELVLVGAHYDGHDISQGALDDGAGTVVCLEAMRVLAALPRGQIGRTIRCVLFCGEEVGLFGSWGYTAAHEDDAARTRFMLNLDTAGRGKGGSETLVLTGAPDLVSYFTAHAIAAKYAYPVRHNFNSHSDHFPYALRGVPTATLSSPDDTSALVGRGWGHTEADTVDKASLRGLQMAAMLTARVLLQIAGDPAFPGRRRNREEVLGLVREAGLEEPLRRSGRLALAGGK
ncbi:MAG: M28 family peptidase [Thermomicrobiales bacterium]